MHHPNHTIKSFLGLLSTLLSVALASPALAQTPTTFTYQGVLSSSGSPLTGQADLRAVLYPTPTDGSAIGTPIELPDTTITQGLFTVPLDFGPAFDPGQPRWLEFSVRSPAGSGPFTKLAPRQLITSTPLAQGLAGIALTRAGPLALDQAQDQPGTIVSHVDVIPPNWQSFTPGRTGTLTQIELIGEALNSLPQTLTMRIRFGVGLTGPILGVVTATLQPSAANTPTTIPIPNLPMQAGYPYTLEFSGPVLLRSALNQIPGASGVRGGNPQNWWFRTYVAPSASINATSASTAFASVAATAYSAETAATATTATSVPWSALTGQPAVTTGAIGTNWQLLFQNTANTNFRGAIRLSDAGFLELTNSANAPAPNFARLNSAGAWTAVSDTRLKTNITTAHNTLAAALKLRPVHFRWTTSGQEDLGLIAQEVRTVLPSLVSGDESKDTLTLNYSQLSVVAIGAIQEQHRTIQAQQRQIHAQQHEIDALKSNAAIQAAEHETLLARLKRLESLIEKRTKE